MNRDREVLELLRDEPELLALADAVHEAERPRRRPRARRGLAGAVAVFLAVAALALVSPWDRGGGPAVVERALAAVGDGPVVHAIVRRAHGELVDLETGRTQPAVRYWESWHDRSRNLVRTVLRVDGEVVFERSGPGAWSDGNDVAESLRSALERGELREAGDGVLRGRRVIWLEGDEAHGVGVLRLAVDAETFAVVAGRRVREGRVEEAWDVLVLETVSREEAGIEEAEDRGGIGMSVGRDSLWGGNLVEVLPLFEGSAVWAGREVGGHELTAAYLVRVSWRPDGGRPADWQALRLVYERHPSDGPIAKLEVEQVPAETAEPVWRARAGEFPPPQGYLHLVRRVSGSAHPGPSWLGTMRAAGVYVQLTGDDRETLLAAARALRPIPPEEGNR